MLASWVVTAVAAGVTKWPSEQLAPSLAALAIMLSYWFSGPAIASEFGLAAAFGIAIQGLSLILVVVWLWKKYSDNGTFRRIA